nr:unnamed protein product [Callosobruchus analis]
MTYDNVTVVGDISVNLLNNANPVTQCCESYGLTNIVQQPTRVTSSSSTLLDPVFTNRSEIFINSARDKIASLQLMLEKVARLKNTLEVKCPAYKTFKACKVRFFWSSTKSSNYKFIHLVCKAFAAMVLFVFSQIFRVATCHGFTGNLPFLTTKLPVPG